MERDFLEDQLRRKLEGYRETPPGDGWSRIEAGLSGIRPRRSLKWVRYAVAASLLAGVATVGVYLAERDDASLAVLRSAAEPVSFSQVVPQPEPPAVRVIRTAAASSPNISDWTPAASAGGSGGRVDPPAEERSAAEAPKATPHAESPKTTQPDWYRSTEREHSPKRRGKTRNGISMSLYAGHIGSGSQQSVAPRNMVSMVSSDMSSPVKGSAGVYSVRAGQQDRIWEHRTPITLGAVIGFRILPNTALETGLMFTRLRSTTEEQAISSYDIEQRLDYVGVPISVTYTFLDSRYATFYGRAGGTLEYCVAGRLTTSAKPGSLSDLHTVEHVEVNGLQTSVGAGVGAMFNLTPHMGIYLEPGVSFYLEREDQPESYRTAHPLTFDLRAGLRFRFR